MQQERGAIPRGHGSWSNGGPLTKPVRRGVAGSPAAAALQPSPLTAADDGAPRVLVVDDESSSRRGLAQLLALDGYEVMEASSGSEAIARALARCPALVITDLHMPGMDGLELTRRLTALQPRTVVLMVSAAADDELRERARRAGACGCLPKPLDVDRLLDWLPRLLPVRREMRSSG